MDETSFELDLPGFRFHPTEEELLEFYLKNAISGKKMRCDIIGFVNIYHHDPWNLPGLAKIGEREWYFFVPRDRKHGSGGRPNRTTATGFWKATGSDRKIVRLSDPKRIIGLRKTLVFYKGRAPRGCKTDWVMNEYRLPDSSPLFKDIVLCKIYRKATSLKVLEQRAAMEEEMKTIQQQVLPNSSPLSSLDNMSFCSSQEDNPIAPMPLSNVVFKTEFEEMDMLKHTDHNKSDARSKEMFKGSSLQFPIGKEKLPELQVPKFSNDWSQDSLWLSPWLQNLTPLTNINL